MFHRELACTTQTLREAGWAKWDCVEESDFLAFMLARVHVI